MKSAVDNYEKKNTINNISRTKVHTKGRRRGEFKNWKAYKDKNSVYVTAPVA